jgi:hypothetical protein
MASKQSPLQIVKDKFGSKEKLAKKVAGMFEPGEDEDKDEFVDRLKHVANSKLLHLVEVGERLKALGGREKLAAKVAELKGQAKDSDYVEKLKSFTAGRLIDMHDSLTRRVAGKAKKPPKSQRKKSGKKRKAG